MSIKSDRTIFAIKDAAADFLERHSNRTSLVTVTDVRLSSDGKHADILLSVLPENSATAAISFANRLADEFRDYLKSRIRLRVIPFVRFMLDEGEKNRQRMEELNTRLETE